VLTQDKLSQTIFPLADLTKKQVRKLAEEYALPVADRPDSQDLCFVGQGDYRDFLRKSNPSSLKPGPIIDLDGKSLGEHPGLADFTIGQRKRLGISSPEPLYVIQKDLKNNTLIVGSREYLGQGEFYVDNVNWISGEAPAVPISANVKIRYKSGEVPSIITVTNSASVQIQLDSPLPDITPGQAAVFYQNDICLGGGIIRSD
jgi:tRNA-specific 2-thiouridylase